MRRARHVAEALILAILLLGLYVQTNTGAPDNGDFSRAMTLYTSGPVGFAANWPAPGTADWDRRFFKYWLPYWQLDLPLSAAMYGSADLLWLPGVLLNYLLVSRDTLYLGNVAILPKIALICLLLLVFKWVEDSDLDESEKTVAVLASCVPLSLVFISTNYIVYFSSFYFETASFIFLLAFLASLVHLDKHRSARHAYVLSLLCLAGLVTAKPSNVYWVALGLFFVLPALWLRRKRARYAVLFVVLALVLALATMRLSQYPRHTVDATHQNSVFFGLLTLSTRVPEQLAALRMPESRECIGQNAFTPIGSACVQAYAARLHLADRAQIMLREPAIAPRMMAFLLNSMQETHIWSNVHPAARTPAAGNAVDIWSDIKSRLFPRGARLALTLIAYLALILWNVRGLGFRREIALIGLVCVTAIPIDMAIAFLGDGRQEIVKHLLLSNFMFDIATIVVTTLLALHLLAVANGRFRPRQAPLDQESSLKKGA